MHTNTHMNTQAINTCEQSEHVFEHISLNNSNDARNTPAAPMTPTAAAATARSTRCDTWALVTSIAIALPIAWGDYVHRVFSAGDTWHMHSAYWPVTGLWTLAIIAVLYLSLHVVFCSLDRSFKQSQPTSTDTSREKRQPTRASHPFAAHVAIICICWSPYLLLRFPGNLDPDTQWQLLEFYGLASRTDQHPWFDTLVFGAFWQLGKALGSFAWSLLLYEFIQMACTACTFALCIRWMHNAGLPRTLQRFTLIFAALYPAIPLFAQTMAKDMLFAWPYLLFLLCLAEAARTRGAAFASWRFVGAFGVVTCLMMLTKKTGLYIAVISCIVLIAYIWWWSRRDQRQPHAFTRAIAMLCAALALVGGVWQHVALPAMGVQPGPSKETMSIITQQTALYIAWHGDEMSDEDWQTVSDVFTDAHNLGTVYDPYRADATKDSWVSNAPSAAKWRFLRWYAATMLRNPGVFFISWGATALPLLYPDTTTQADESFVSYRNNLPAASTSPSAIGSEAYLCWQTGDTTADSLARVQALMRSSYRPAWAARIADSFDTAYAWLEHYTPVLFIKATFTTWIPLICAAYCLRRRNGLGLVMLVPAFVTLATLAAAAIVLPRYLVASVYALPLALAAAVAR
ncbi:hypothetical protein CLV65_0604 [Pseudoscardovia suis]|uniref:Glycosyltransferase RgtA/B/C/D-like domain-containing protein n=2 Tax=Pseudoscardovia suis TaxID=987063 RepID=A0A261EX45_9BIFI|nr:hypothetical protein PSSU_1038 [Pseudoscardovia suis]PJJ68702.1 hypothetical protein CLV65_0604 [Pseudoscardovia suis]